MKKIVCILLGVLVISTFSAQAQFNNYLKEKQKKIIKSATKKADEKVDEEIDKKVQKGVDKLFNKLSKEIETATDSIDKAKDSTEASGPSNESSNSEERLNTAIGNFMKSAGVGVDVPHKDVYDFKSHMNMLIEHTNANGTEDDPMFYNIYYNESAADYGMVFKDESSSNSIFVFDSENNCTLILMDDGQRKTGIATRISEDKLNNYEAGAEDYIEEEMGKPEDYNFKKTGNTKVISGFKCEEYKAEDENAVLSMWVTKDLKGKMNKKLYSNQYFGGSFWMADKLDGVVIQYIDESKTSKELNKMTVKEVNLNSKKTISTAGYSITGISM